MSHQPLESAPGPGLTSEVGHVLAVELVGLSRFTHDEQPGVITEFQRLIMGTPQARESLNSNRLLTQRREHGMLLVFLGDPLAAMKCALQAANEAKRRPNIRLRMGIHSGSVHIPADLTDERDCTGEALAGALLLMAAGGEGHILASESAAKAGLTVELWAQYIHDLGTCEIRPGTTVRLFSLFGGSIGNPSHPMARRAEAQQQSYRRPRRVSAGAVAFTLSLLIVGGAAAAWFTKPEVRTWAENRYRAIFPPPPKSTAEKKNKKARSVRTRKDASVRRVASRVSSVRSSPGLSASIPRAPEENRPAETADSNDFDPDSGHHTALIINATGLGVTQGESIRVMSADGSELWSGVPAYSSSAGRARNLDIAGQRPLSLRASRLTDGAITISSASAEILRGAISENPFLDSNCVIIVY